MNAVATIVDLLPNECWIHILGYLNIDEVRRISLKISQSLAHQLLNTDEDYNSIYRFLCEVQMKEDLEKAIQEIDSRLIIDSVRYYSNYNSRDGPKISRTNTECSRLSMKQMRENLKFCTIRAKSLFPHWFKENSILDERIHNCIKKSFSANSIYIAASRDDDYHSGMSQETVDKLKNLRENETIETEKKVTEFMTHLVLKPVGEKQKKHPKWKQIWNGYYKQSTRSQFKKSVGGLVFDSTKSRLQQQRRRYRDLQSSSSEPTKCELFKQYLTNMYNTLLSLPMETRRLTMFKTLKFPFKVRKPWPQPPETKHSSLFSQIVSGVYKLSQLYNLVGTGIEEIYEKLLYLFIDESIAYKVKTPILVECFQENNSPIHMLLRTVCFPELGLKVLRKYARHLKGQSLGFKLYLLVKCMSTRVNLKIIHELFYNGTINEDVLSHTFRKNSFSRYFLSVLSRRCHSTESSYYYADIHNLIVNCFKHAIPRSIKETTPNEKVKPHLLWTRSSMYKEFLESALDYQVYYGDEVFFFKKTMINHYDRFSEQKKITMHSEETPLHDYVHFEKPKYNNLNDFRRRKY